jgi:hypothetical protein
LDTTKLSYYLPAYLALVYSSVITVFSFTSIDGFFVGLCIHLTGQFEVIKTKINDLFEKTVGKGKSRELIITLKISNYFL